MFIDQLRAHIDRILNEVFPKRERTVVITMSRGLRQISALTILWLWDRIPLPMILDLDLQLIDPFFLGRNDCDLKLAKNVNCSSKNILV